MPNTLTTIFKSTPSTEPVEAPHPNTGVYITGTQLADGTWQVIHTGITKTTTPPTMAGRLKNYPAVVASIVASGNILNIQQPAPTGTSAVGSSANSINITANSGANATAYRFFSSSAQAGPFALLVTQASASYAHTGLASGAVVWYQMQYVGGGFYDDSPLSVAFSGTAVTSQTVFAPLNSNYSENQSTVSDASGIAQPNPAARLFFTTNAATVNLVGTAAFDGDVSLLQDNGTLVGSYIVSATAQTLTLPGTGSRNFYLQMGGAQRTGEVGAVQANGITSLTFPAGTTNALYKPAFTDRIAVVGDSITVRGGNFPASVKSLGPYLRGLAISSRAVTMLAYGAHKLANAIYADADWAITKAQILAAVAGGTTRTVYFEASTNDYGLGSYLDTDLAAKLQARVQDLQASDTGLRVVLQTMLLQGYEVNTNVNAVAPNLGTATPSQWRTAMEVIKSNVPAVILAKGQNMIASASLLSDGTHPTQAGNDQYFPAVASYLTGTGDIVFGSPTDASTAVLFPTLSTLVESPATVFKPTAAAAEGYGSTGLSSQYLPAGVSGRIFAYYYKPAVGSSSAVFGVKLGAGIEPFGNFLAGVSGNSGAAAGLYIVDGGTATASTIYTLNNGTYLGIYRDGATGIISLQRWNGAGWVNIQTYTATSTAALYIGVDVYNHPADTTFSGVLLQPQGTGIVAINAASTANYAVAGYADATYF